MKVEDAKGDSWLARVVARGGGPRLLRNRDEAAAAPGLAVAGMPCQSAESELPLPLSCLDGNWYEWTRGEADCLPLAPPPPPLLVCKALL